MNTEDFEKQLNQLVEELILASKNHRDSTRVSTLEKLDDTLLIWNDLKVKFNELVRQRPRQDNERRARPRPTSKRRL